MSPKKRQHKREQQKQQQEQQQKKRTDDNVSEAQQTKEASLAPNVPAQRAANKNATEQHQAKDPAEEMPTSSLPQGQGHTEKNKNNSTKGKPTEPHLEVTEAPKQDLRPATLQTPNPFSGFSFGGTEPMGEMPPSIFGTSSFGLPTTWSTTTPLSFGATATAEKKNSKPAGTKSLKKQPTKPKQPQMANEKILETIQGALSTMPAINIEQATEEEQRDLVHVLRSALSNKNPILVPPTTNNPTEAKNPIEVPTVPHCSHCCDADQLSNMVTAILSSSKGAGACDICAQNAKMEVVMWMCLHCAKNFCAPEEDGKPQGHARRHASESEHWIATRILDPRAGFCFSCERDVSVEGNNVVEVDVVDNKTTSEVEEVVDPKESGRPPADQMEDNKGSPIVAGVPVVSTLAQHSSGGGTKAQTEVKTQRGQEEKEQEEESATLNFIGPLDKAKLRASLKCRWLIVNLQSSHMLNPNILGEELLSSIIMSNFIFWQVDYETEEGRNACMEYNLSSKLLPAFLLINPFTGQAVKRWYKVVERALSEDILPSILDDGSPQPPQGTSTSVRKEDEVLIVVTPLVGESDRDDMGKLEENEPINIKLGYPSLPEEPHEPDPEPPEGPHSCKVEIRLPNGRRIWRNFCHTDPIKLLWSFSYPEVKDGDKRAFHFVQIVPGKCRHLNFESDLTFKDAHIANSTLNFLWD